MQKKNGQKPRLVNWNKSSYISIKKNRKISIHSLNQMSDCEKKFITSKKIQCLEGVYAILCLCGFSITVKNASKLFQLMNTILLLLFHTHYGLCMNCNCTDQIERRVIMRWAHAHCV